jgi:hypothetical protein
LILAGDTGPLVSLQSARRALWEKNARLVDERIAKRAKDGAGMADTAEWGQIAEEIDKTRAAVAARDSDALVASCARLMTSAVPSPKPLGPYVDRPRLDGVRVSFRLLARKDLARLVGPIARLEREASKLTDDEVERYIEADGDAAAAQLEYVRHTVAEIHHDRGNWSAKAGPDGLPIDAALMIERLKIVGDLFMCAREAQDLDPFELATFGGSPQPISRTSSAHGVRSLANPDSGASTLAPFASEGPSTSREPVRGESSFAIPTSPSSSSFTAAPTEGSAASTLGASP